MLATLESYCTYKALEATKRYPVNPRRGDDFKPSGFFVWFSILGEILAKRTTSIQVKNESSDKEKVWAMFIPNNPRPESSLFDCGVTLQRGGFYAGG